MEPKATTFLQREFMTMLHRNGMMDYAIVPPSTENESLCLQGENSFRQAELMDPEVASLCTTFKNSWRKSEHQIVLMSTFCHFHMVTETGNLCSDEITASKFICSFRLIL